MDPRHKTILVWIVINAVLMVLLEFVLFEADLQFLP